MVYAPFTASGQEMYWAYSAAPTTRIGPVNSRVAALVVHLLLAGATCLLPATRH